MPGEIDQRMMLGASLNNLINGEKIKYNVDRAEKAIRHYTDIADKTAQNMLTRQESRFLSERLEFEDLRQVGHYSGDWKQVKDKRVITFSKGEMGIEFTFQRGDYSSKESLNDLIEIASSTNTDNFQRAAEGMILNVAAGQKNKHPSEMLLGQESRTLKHYELTSVVKVTTKPKVVLSFEIPGFFTKERDVLYPLVK